MSNSTSNISDTYTEHFWPLITINFGVEALIAIHILTMLVAIPGNLLVIIIILRNKSLQDEAAYLLICSVSIADILVSILSQPLNIAVLIIGIENTSEVLNLLLYFCVWGFCGASAFGVVCITIDRFLYIMYPMHYNRMLSHKRTYMLIAIQWFCGLCYGLLPMIDINKSHFPTAIASLVTLLCMTACMAIVYKRVHMNISRLNKSEMKKLENKRKQNNATITIAFIVLTFFLCWFPYITINFINAVYTFKSDSPIRALYYWFEGLGCWNSAFNVIIYGFKNGTLKHEAKKYLRIKRMRIDPEYESKSNRQINKQNSARKINSVSDIKHAHKERQAIGNASHRNEYSTFKQNPTSPLRQLNIFRNGFKFSLKPNLPKVSQILPKKTSKDCVLQSFSSENNNNSNSSEDSVSTRNTVVPFTTEDTKLKSTEISNLKESGYCKENSLKLPKIKLNSSLLDLSRKFNEDCLPVHNTNQLRVPNYLNIAYEDGEEINEKNTCYKDTDTIKKISAYRIDESNNTKENDDKVTLNILTTNLETIEDVIKENVSNTDEENDDTNTTHVIVKPLWENFLNKENDNRTWTVSPEINRDISLEESETEQCIATVEENIAENISLEEQLTELEDDKEQYFVNAEMNIDDITSEKSLTELEYSVNAEMNIDHISLHKSELEMDQSSTDQVKS